MLRRYKTLAVSFMYNRTSMARTPFTLKCLNIGTPKTVNFPFVSNGKLMGFRCPNIQAHYTL